MVSTTVIGAFLLTLFAGLSTIIGAVIVVFYHKPTPRFLSWALGFSAGVMLYVSFTEIFHESEKMLAQNLDENVAGWLSVLAFFSGIGLIWLIDKFLPAPEGSENVHHLHHIHDVNDIKRSTIEHRKMMRLGVYSAIVIAIHNFPEGIISFSAAMTDITLGVSLAIAIALHNIPEGIAIALPIFQATKSRKKAIIYSAISGLSEPIGALIGYTIFSTLLSDSLIGIMLAAVAGMMTFISIDQLLPCSRECTEEHLTALGFVSGMAVMAVSLLVF